MATEYSNAQARGAALGSPRSAFRSGSHCSRALRALRALRAVRTPRIFRAFPKIRAFPTTRIFGTGYEARANHKMRLQPEIQPLLV
jgi:hypothetical protein